MSVTVQGRARIRKVGNGLCLPLPRKALRGDHIDVGDEVEYIILKPRRAREAVFGAARKYFEGVRLQDLADEDRASTEE